MIVNVTSTFRCTFEVATKWMSTSALHAFVSRPILTVEPADGSAPPEVWTDGDVPVRMRLFRHIPFGTQVLGVERISTRDPDEFVIRDNGRGDLAKTWDHWVFIRRTDDPKRTRYTDRVEVRAGLLTPVAWAFAQVFYRWRQHRWKVLVRRGFAQLGPSGG